MNSCLNFSLLMSCSISFSEGFFIMCEEVVEVLPSGVGVAMEGIAEGAAYDEACVFIVVHLFTVRRCCMIFFRAERKSRTTRSERSGVVRACTMACQSASSSSGVKSSGFMVSLRIGVRGRVY